MEFQKVLKQRRSIRKYLSKKVEEEKINKLIESVKFVPTAHNVQYYEVFIVKKQELKDKIAEAALSQEFVAQAPIVFIFCIDLKKAQGWREELYAVQAATMAAYAVSLEAFNLGLGSCFVGAFEKERVKKMLNLSENLEPIIILPVGYAAEKPRMPERRTDYFRQSPLPKRKGLVL